MQAEVSDMVLPVHLQEPRSSSYCTAIGEEPESLPLAIYVVCTVVRNSFSVHPPHPSPLQDCWLLHKESASSQIYPTVCLHLTEYRKSVGFDMLLFCLIVFWRGWLGIYLLH